MLCRFYSMLSMWVRLHKSDAHRWLLLERDYIIRFCCICLGVEAFHTNGRMSA